ncbi:ABC transporter permease [Sporosarcina sp. FSL K6-2383]|uniref:ABC transporter permease n=1 Tax=Sporosarcina sp. FSL K6-2383 TaxID=2921556 RepID=UPI00315ABAD6
MLNLMRLEMKKFKLGASIKGAIITNFIIAALVVAVLFISKAEGEPAFQSYPEALGIIDSIIRATFIIFASTLISKLIIGEFKNKTITTLFLYPINRKKLIAAKLAIVVLFTFCSIIVSNIFITAVCAFTTNYFNLIPDALTVSMIAQHTPAVFMNAIAASGMCLIPLYFGMKKYSVPTTIISSILIVMIVSSNSDGFSLNNIIVIPISLAVIGISVAYFAIRNIEKLDLSY